MMSGKGIYEYGTENHMIIDKMMYIITIKNFAISQTVFKQIDLMSYRLELKNAQTASLQSGKTPLTSVPGMTLNNQMVILGI